MLPPWVMVPASAATKATSPNRPVRGAERRVQGDQGDRQADEGDEVGAVDHLEQRVGQHSEHVGRAGLERPPGQVDEGERGTRGQGDRPGLPGQR